MKFGFRVPSLTKRIAARTSLKRVIRHRLGLKAPSGWGWLTNPRRAAYNRVYNRTTTGCAVILFVTSLRSVRSSDESAAYTWFVNTDVSISSMGEYTPTADIRPWRTPCGTGSAVSGRPRARQPTIRGEPAEDICRRNGARHVGGTFEEAARMPTPMPDQRVAADATLSYARSLQSPPLA